MSIIYFGLLENKIIYLFAQNKITNAFSLIFWIHSSANRFLRVSDGTYITASFDFCHYTNFSTTLEGIALFHMVYFRETFWNFKRFPIGFRVFKGKLYWSLLLFSINLRILMLSSVVHARIAPAIFYNGTLLSLLKLLMAVEFKFHSKVWN